MEISTIKVLQIGLTLSKNKYVVRCSGYGKFGYIGNFIAIEAGFLAYKRIKEKIIKETADKWKNRISDKVYQAMYNYQVEITD